jgi:fermentation-respiration switch protein FrsA (DUF1100 family)
MVSATALVVVLAVAGCGGAGDAPGRSATPAAGATPRYTGPGPAPAGDAFYVPPATLPAGQPGDILWSRRVQAAGPLRGLDVELHEVLYLSTDARGRRDAVSGIIMLPSAAGRGSAPVVGFATGTHGMGDACAPSKSVAAGTDDWLDAFQLAARKGWVIAATDYEGLGTPGEHTYSVGRSEGHAVIDAVRAAQRLDGAGVRRDAKVAFWGYSQGGGAAAWAGELAPSYAPELNTVAVAAGGVPADLIAVSEALNGAAWAGVIFMSALGFDAAYPELKLADYVRPEARASLDRLSTLCLKAALPEFAGKHIQDVLTTDPLQTPSWRTRLQENSLGRTPPAAPVYLYHGRKDTVVAFGQAEALAQAYCREGAKVIFVPYADDDHGATSYRTDPVAAFLTSRFAGEPATSTC